MRRLSVALALSATTCAAQWQLQVSNITASLRGVHAVSDQIAWASGTGGTVLHTTDGGAHWLTCTIPPAAEHFDFRGIQASDASTAIVMSSGKGELSRLYKTTDSCRTWRLLFTNPDPEGFWDGVRVLPGDRLEIVGDSVNHVLVSVKIGRVIPVWDFQEGDDPPGHPSDHFFELPAEQGESSFSASNSTLVLGQSPHMDPLWSYQWLATGTANHSYVHREASEETPTCEPCRQGYLRVETQMSQGSSTAGIFSLGFREDRYGVAVGGDYTKPDAQTKSATYSQDSGQSWMLATNPPHGFRSAVAYSPTHHAWITVGPNGTDMSTDDGKNWHSLRPVATDATTDEDKNWNALSLPFVVGPNGRIGRLRPDVIP